MKTVLIIDDSNFMRTILKNILTQNNFEIIGEANNGLDGIEKYKKLKPDIVTLDITMDKMNGIDCLKNIIEIDNNANVVMCSSNGQMWAIIESIRLGAKDFIIKPFTNDTIIKTFDKIIKS